MAKKSVSYSDVPKPKLMKKACELCVHRNIDIRNTPRNCVACISAPGKKNWKRKVSRKKKLF